MSDRESQIAALLVAAAIVSLMPAYTIEYENVQMEDNYIVDKYKSGSNKQDKPINDMFIL